MERTETRAQIERLARHDIITALMDMADKLAVDQEYVLANLYKHLSRNPNMDVDILSRRLNRPWCWGGMSRNHRIAPLDVIERFRHRPWDWSDVARNPSISVATIIAHRDKFPWQNCWSDVSANPTVTADLVANNLDLPWDWSELSANKGIKLHDILGNLNGRVPNDCWDWHGVSLNPNVTIADVYTLHCDKPWFTREFGRCMSERVDSIEQFESNPQVEWNWSVLSENPCITMDYVRNHPEIPWNYRSMSRNVNLTWSFVKHRQGKHWDWHYLGQHKCVFLRYVTSNPYIPWDGFRLGMNPNLSLDEAWYNRNLLDVRGVMTNSFDAARAQLFIHHVHRHVSALRIQLLWRRAIRNPFCKIGRVYQLRKLYKISK